MWLCYRHLWSSCPWYQEPGGLAWTAGPGWLHVESTVLQLPSLAHCWGLPSAASGQCGGYSCAHSTPLVSLPQSLWTREYTYHMILTDCDLTTEPMELGNKAWYGPKCVLHSPCTQTSPSGEEPGHEAILHSMGNFASHLGLSSLFRGRGSFLGLLYRVSQFFETRVRYKMREGFTSRSVWKARASVHYYLTLIVARVSLLYPSWLPFPYPGLVTWDWPGYGTGVTILGMYYHVWC